MTRESEESEARRLEESEAGEALFRYGYEVDWLQGGRLGFSRVFRSGAGSTIVHKTKKAGPARLSDPIRLNIFDASKLTHSIEFKSLRDLIAVLEEHRTL